MSKHFEFKTKPYFTLFAKQHFIQSNIVTQPEKSTTFTYIFIRICMEITLAYELCLLHSASIVIIDNLYSIGV